VLRYRLRFVNRQPHRVWVHGADKLSWWFDDNGGRYRTLWVNQWVKAGKQGNSDHGLFAGWEFDGCANAHVRQFGSAQYLELSAAVLWLNQPLEADEEFAVPYAFVGVFQGDWDDAGRNSWRRACAWRCRIS
jgi:hypothetical protein